MPKFPNVTAQITGQDGNAFMVMGIVQKAMRRGGCTPDEVKAYLDDAMSGDYDHLLRVTMETVEVA